MLILYDKDHNKIVGLTNYKEYKVEREINVEDALSFQYPVNDIKHELIQEECYIRTKDNEYVIKEVNFQDDDWTEYVCKVNIEDLKGKNVDHFETVDQKCEDGINIAITGTGWTVGKCDVTKQRTVKKNNCTVYDVLTDIQSAYNCEMCFDAINKKIYVYNQMGEDKGVYLAEQLNLKKLEVQRNSYDYITRLIPIGKDGLDIKDVNDGKNYIENHQYSNKVITAYWEDNRYTVSSELLEDAIARLDYLSRPYKSYKADVIDLANYSKEYSILDYSLGDTITLLAKSKDTKEQQRIVKSTKYPEESERSTIELANKIASLDQLNVRFQDTSDTVDTVTNSDGTIDGSKVDSIDWDKIQHVHIDMADIEKLNATIANIGKLNATEGNITDLNSVNANIQNLLAPKANVDDLTAANARIITLETDTASIQNLLAGHIGADNIEAAAIEAGSAIIADGAISSAQIIDLDVSKLKAGNISTNKFVVQSDSGNLQLKENTFKVWDTIGKERISLGLNGSDYNLLVRGADGNTVLFGTDGVTKAGITNGAVDDSKVDTNANINANKINIDSMFTALNGNTNTLKASKIKFDDNGQTLDVSFSNLSKTVSDTSQTVSNQSTTISAMQGQIATKVTQTEINNSIDAVQIGGRNLLRNSNFSNSNNYWSDVSDIISDSIYGCMAHWNLSNSGATGHQNLTISHGTYTMSAIVKASDYSKITGIGFVFFYTDSSYTDYTWNNHKWTDLGNGYKKVATTGSTNTSKTLDHAEIRLYTNSGVTVEFWTGKIKFEEGNKATDWTPAPEDIQTQIDSATTRISTCESGISQNAKGITLKVSTSDYNGNTIASLINQSASTVTINASKVAINGSVMLSNWSSAGDATKIDGNKIYTGSISADKITVGNNVNLMPYNIASFESYSSGENIPSNGNNGSIASIVASTDYALDGVMSVKITNGNSTDGYVYLGNLRPMVAGKWYCFSYYAYTTQANIQVVGMCVTNTGVHIGPNNDMTLTPNQWCRQSVTFQAPSGVTSFQTRVDVDSANATVYFDCLQMEEVAGNYGQPSGFTSPSATIINGANIRANSIAAEKISAGTITGCTLKTNSSNNHALISDNYLGIFRDFSGGMVGSSWGTYMEATTWSAYLDFNAIDPTGENLTTLEIGNKNASTYITSSPATQGLTLNAPSLHLNMTAGNNGMFVQNAACNTGIELGKLTTAETPYIDFHSSGTNNDYDSRIIADGCNSAGGQGNLSVCANWFKIPKTWVNPQTAYGGTATKTLTVGDSDSGINWDGDGDLGFYSNGNRLIRISGGNSVRFDGNQPMYESNHILYSAEICYFSYNYNGGNQYASFATSGAAYGFNIWNSDVSYKENIKDSTEDALNKISAIPTREFDWIVDGKHQKLGIISQEIMNVDSNFAFGVSQPDGTVKYQPNEPILIPYLIKSIQQLNDKITLLENKIQQLTAGK